VQWLRRATKNANGDHRKTPGAVAMSSGSALISNGSATISIGSAASSFASAASSFRGDANEIVRCVSGSHSRSMRSRGARSSYGAAASWIRRR
jgi:hypothetical protein